MAWKEKIHSFLARCFSLSSTRRRRKRKNASSSQQRSKGITTSDEIHDRQPSFIHLPADLKQYIVEYLPTREALRLSMTNKQTSWDLGLVVRPPFKILEPSHWIGDSDTGGVPRIATRIPVFVSRDCDTLSITVQCQWWDQGYGDRKGKFYIVGHKPDDDDFDIFSGHLVAESPSAQHFAMKLTLSFHPKKDEIYYLWYKVGGGDGRHQLNVGEVVIYALVLDRKKKTTPSDQLHLQPG